jgi:hypothetical protein
MLMVREWAAKGPRERGCLPISLNLRGGGRAVSDDRGEHGSDYSVSLRRTVREGEGRLQNA